MWGSSTGSRSLSVRACKYRVYGPSSNAFARNRNRALGRPSRRAESQRRAPLSRARTLKGDLDRGSRRCVYGIIRHVYTVVDKNERVRERKAEPVAGLGGTMERVRSEGRGRRGVSFRVNGEDCKAIHRRRGTRDTRARAPPLDAARDKRRAVAGLLHA